MFNYRSYADDSEENQRPMCQYSVIVIIRVVPMYSPGEKGVVHVPFIEIFHFF